jgi:uncharacterized protein
MLPLAVLTIVCVLTYSFEIVFGLAGTIMMLTVMSLLYDSKTLVIYSVLPQIMVGTIGLARSPKTVDIRFLGKMLAFAAFGAALGLALFYYFSSRVFHLSLAGAITTFGLYLVIAPGGIHMPPFAARLLDTVAGVSQALFGISGPIAMTRLLATFREKTIIRNYALAFFLSLNFIRLGGYLVNATITVEIGKMMLVSAPFLGIALWYSNRLHFKIKESHFRRVVAWIILLSGLTLFYH